MKKNPKAIAMKSHKIMVHLMCLMDDLDEMDADSAEAKDMMETIKILLPKIDRIVDSLFGSSEYLKSNTYLQEMQNKFETVVRKNYKQITE